MSTLPHSTHTHTDTRVHTHRPALARSCLSLTRRYGPGMHPYDGRVTSNFLVQVMAP